MTPRNRPPTEVAHVAPQRFGAGDREHNCGQRKNAMWKCPTMNVSAYTGASALRISGWSMMPSTAGADPGTGRDHHRPEQSAQRRPCRGAARRTARR